jgi:hypothetical protein
MSAPNSANSARQRAASRIFPRWISADKPLRNCRLPRMGFRGSRVQIPPSRLSRVHGSAGSEPRWGFTFPRHLQSVVPGDGRGRALPLCVGPTRGRQTRARAHWPRRGLLGRGLVPPLLGRQWFVWNNTCGDRATLSYNGSVIDSAFYRPNPPEGVLVRVEGTDELVPARQLSYRR